MKLGSFRLALVLCSLLPATVLAGDVKAGRSEYPVKYEGGSLPLGHAKVKATLGADGLVFVQHGRRVIVAPQDITDISFGEEVRRRFGATLLGLLPLMDLDKAETHYVGVGWAGDPKDGCPRRVEVIFKISKHEYRNFLSALESATGKKAVDTNRVARSVRYDL